MIFILQFLLLVILLAFDLGPLARHFSAIGGPQLLIVTAWAMAWFSDKRTYALSWVILAGIVVDLIGFTPFGAWTAALLLVVGVTILLKNRYFEVVSSTLALLTLAVASLSAELLLLLIVQALDWRRMLLVTISNVAVGALLYYVLAIRFRLLSRWQGRRL